MAKCPKAKVAAKTAIDNPSKRAGLFFSKSSFPFNDASGAYRNYSE
jgi:hypothetical protein